jgi:hypothetical protein
MGRPKTKTDRTIKYGNFRYNLSSVDGFTSEVKAKRIAYKARKKHGTRIRVVEYEGRWYFYISPPGRTLKKLKRRK